jgi:hypothetical protein
MFLDMNVREIEAGCLAFRILDKKLKLRSSSLEAQA